MTRTEWLASLKVGDKFAITIGWGGKRFAIRTITGETKTRWKADTVEYTKVDGEPYPRNHGFNYLSWMQPVTDEIIKSIKRQQLLNTIGQVKWGVLPTEILEAVAELIKGKGGV